MSWTGSRGAVRLSAGSRGWWRVDSPLNRALVLWVGILVLAFIFSWWPWTPFAAVPLVWAWLLWRLLRG